MSKNKESNTLKCLWTLVVVILVLVILALVFALADIDCEKLKFDFEKLMTIVGIIVSTVGLFITVYFVVLAVDAYSNIKKIEEIKTEVKKIERKASLLSGNIESTFKYYCDFLYEELNEQIAFCNKDTISKKDRIDRRKRLRIKEARMCYQFPLLDKEKRLKLLSELGSLGESEDISYVEDLINQEKDNEIIELAKEVLIKLREKYHRKSK